MTDSQQTCSWGPLGYIELHHHRGDDDDDGGGGDHHRDDDGENAHCDHFVGILTPSS